MTIPTQRPARLAAAMRTAFAAAVLVLILAGCQNDPAKLFPRPEARTDAYVLLSSGSRLGLAANLLEVVEVEASSTFDKTTVVGIDGIVENWRRVMEGAKVDMVSRRIMATNDIGSLGRRDSGTVTFRLKTPEGGFRDTTMIFITTWAYKDKHWRIRDDAVFAR